MISEPVVGSVLYLTAAQMTEVDRIAVERYGISLVQMMENAGREFARLARDRFLGGDARGHRVIVLVGNGGNGGGALVAARHLHNWGAAAEVVLAQEARTMKLVPRRQLAILRRLNVPIRGHGATGTLRRPDLALDGLIGYGLTGAPGGAAAALIHWANRAGAPIASLDLPSGLDATTGKAYDPTIRAAATLTLALPKTGLRPQRAITYVGELYLADIGIPAAVYAHPKFGLDIGGMFARHAVIRLR